MAVTLGKRKRRVNQVSGHQDVGEGRAGLDEGPRPEDVFRRLFEARFRPLVTGNPSEGEGEGLQEGSDVDAEEWAGFSDEEEEEEHGVEVVEYDGKVVGAVDRLARREVKAFMVRGCASCDDFFWDCGKEDADSC
jgi:hypothetical protein